MTRRGGCAAVAGSLSTRSATGAAVFTMTGWAFLVAPGVVWAQDPMVELERYVEAAVADWDVPGLAFAVVKGNELLLARGLGVLDLEQPEKEVDEETLFSIGSTTKAMTAAALGMLVDEGQIAWDDPVREHLSWFELSDPYVTREITIRDLLTHRAGLGNADFLWYGQDVGRREVLERVREAEPAYSLRSSFIYQNIMYAAAGAVVEAVSGETWEGFMRRRILDPLAMSRTVTTLEETKDQPNVARPHYLMDGKVQPISNASVDAVAAAGSIWSSVEDMSRWMRLLLARGVTASGERLLSAGTVDELFRPQTLVPLDQFYPTASLTRPNWVSYGLGWFQHDYRGRKLDFHTGSIDGMVAIAGLIREEGIGVYVLGNLDHAEVRHAIMYHALDVLLDEVDRDWHQEVLGLYRPESRGDDKPEVAVDGGGQGAADEVAGRYSDPLFGTVAVSDDDGVLWLRYGPGLQGPLERNGPNTYQVRWEAEWRGVGNVVLHHDRGGDVAALILNGMRFGRSR